MKKSRILILLLHTPSFFYFCISSASQAVRIIKPRTKTLPRTTAQVPRHIERPLEQPVEPVIRTQPAVSSTAAREKILPTQMPSLSYTIPYPEKKPSISVVERQPLEQPAQSTFTPATMRLQKAGYLRIIMPNETLHKLPIIWQDLFTTHETKDPITLKNVFKSNQKSWGYDAYYKADPQTIPQDRMHLDIIVDSSVPEATAKIIELISTWDLPKNADIQFHDPSTTDFSHLFKSNVSEIFAEKANVIQTQKETRALETATKKALLEKQLKLQKIKEKLQKAEQETSSKEAKLQETDKSFIESEKTVQQLESDIQTARQDATKLQEQTQSLATEIKKTQQEIQETEQHKRNIAEIKTFTEEIVKELDEEGQKIAEAFGTHLQHQENALQNEINLLDNSIQNRNKNITDITQQLEALEQEKQHALAEQARAENTYELQQSQQKEQHALQEQEIVKEEQAHLQEQQELDHERKQRLREQLLTVEEEYKAELENLKTEHALFETKEHLPKQHVDVVRQKIAETFDHEEALINTEVAELTQQLKTAQEKQTTAKASYEAQRAKLEADHVKQELELTQEQQKLLQEHEGEANKRFAELELLQKQQQITYDQEIELLNQELAKIEEDAALRIQKIKADKERARAVIAQKFEELEPPTLTTQKIKEGSGTIEEKEEKEKIEPHEATTLTGVEKMAVMPITMPPLEISAFELPETQTTAISHRATPQEKPITSTPRTSTTQTSYVPSSAAPFPLFKRSQKATAPSIPAYPSRPGDVKIVKEPFKPWHKEKTKEYKPGTYSMPTFRGTGYEEVSKPSRYSPTISSSSTQETTEEKLHIPYTQMKITKEPVPTSTPQKVGQKMPQTISVEETPAVEEEWKPLPKKVWPKKTPVQEKDVAKKVGWFAFIRNIVIDTIGNIVTSFQKFVESTTEAIYNLFHPA